MAKVPLELTGIPTERACESSWNVCEGLPSVRSPFSPVRVAIPPVGAPEVREPVLLHHPTRKSVGSFGAVRLRDGKFVYQRKDKVFDRSTFFSFLQALRKRSCRAGRRVVLLLDNARYHHARLHKQWRQDGDDLFH